MCKRAFTLVEVLAVTAIVAVLSGILLPAFGVARESARRTQCVANLRNIGVALSCYLSDYNGVFPSAWRGYYVRQGRQSLRRALEGYDAATRVWECPSDIGEVFVTDPSTYRAPTPPFHRMCDQSYEYMGLGTALDDGGIGGVSVMKLKEPARTIVCFEYRPWHGPYRRTDRVLSCPARYNVLYSDSHIDGRRSVDLSNDLRASRD